MVRGYDDNIWDAGVRCGHTSGVCLRPKIGTREVPTPPLETNPKMVRMTVGELVLVYSFDRVNLPL